MKNILLLFLCLTGFIIRAEAQENRITKNSGFEKTIALIKSNRFLVEVNRAFPLGGKSIDLFSNRGKITVSDSVAQGFLPFFGRAYSFLPGEDGGIHFESKMEKKELKVKDKKKRKHLLYRFTVKGENDTYELLLDISANASCSLSVRSNRKSQISYEGTISPLPSGPSEH